MRLCVCACVGLVLCGMDGFIAMFVAHHAYCTAHITRVHVHTDTRVEHDANHRQFGKTRKRYTFNSHDMLVLFEERKSDD